MFLLAGVVRNTAGAPLMIQRWYSVAHRLQEFAWCIRTDASPFGFGAILFFNGHPQAWSAGSWEQTDLDLLKALPGEAAWQAEW